MPLGTRLSDPSGEASSGRSSLANAAGVAVPGALTAPAAVAKNPIFVCLPQSAHKGSADKRFAPFEGSCPMEDCRHEEVAI